MDIHDSNYKEKREAKKERYEELGEKNHKLSKETSDQARKMQDVIPFGQPILVGHHSEKGDRSYRGKIEKKWEKSFEISKKADYYDDKVKSMTRNRAISSDDPEAVTKLQEKIIKERRTHATAKAKRKDFRDRKVELIKELGDREYHLKYYLLESYMTGATVEIKRCEGRIADIQALEKIPDIDETINNIRLYTEDARIRIDFGFKPDEETRTKLKQHSFKWSPYNQVWQNYIKQRNIDFARELLQGMK